jgi:hypothetical protein
VCACAVVFLSAVVASASFLGADDSLARSEFDREMSVSMEQANIVDVFRLLADATGVPFILDFPVDPSLTVTFNATNMVSRGILASLASTHGLRYSTTRDGVVVYRQDVPRAIRPTRVGNWREEAAPHYLLEFVFRDSNGRVLARPRISARLGVAEEFRLSVRGDDVIVLDRSRSAIETRRIGGLTIVVCIKRHTRSGLEIVMEFVTTRPLGKTRFVEDHILTTKTLGPDGGDLLENDEGHQIALVSWRRL